MSRLRPYRGVGEWSNAIVCRQVFSYELIPNSEEWDGRIVTNEGNGIPASISGVYVAPRATRETSFSQHGSLESWQSWFSVVSLALHFPALLSETAQHEPGGTNKDDQVWSIPLQTCVNTGIATLERESVAKRKNAIIFRMMIDLLLSYYVPRYKNKRIIVH